MVRPELVRAAEGRAVKRIRASALIALLALGVSCTTPQERYATVVDVVPVVHPELAGGDGPPEFEAMLASYVHQGAVHGMTYYGDFDQFVREHHQLIMEYFEHSGSAASRKRGCSMFRFTGPDGTTLVGRNYDNVFTELLVGWFYPTGGYSSIAFVPMSDLGFGKDRPFDPADPIHRRTLLNGPVTAIEGMNEKGLTVTLASLERRQVAQIEGRQPRFLIHLVRELLDHAATVDEAIELAASYNVFDNGRELISHHIFVTAPGDSVVLEWRDGTMHTVREARPWQVVTNSDLLGVAEAQRRRSCDRYRVLARTLDGRAGTLSWAGAMDALASVSQHNRAYVLDGERRRISTQWSAVFEPSQREVLVCLGRDLGTVYRLRFP